MKNVRLTRRLLLAGCLPFLAGTGHAQEQNTAPAAALYSAGMQGAAPGALPPLVPVISFNEHPVNHNMHIASDGDYYFTINGGSAGSGQVQQFDLAGNLVQTYPIAIDGRGLSYNAADGKLYVSTFGGNIARIDDLAAGTFTVLYTGIMQNGQASFAFSPDGTLFYDFYAGTLYVRSFATGAIVDTLTGLLSGTGNYGGEAAVAADTGFVYTWNAAAKTVYRYDFNGVLAQTFTLQDGDNGHSLSMANGLLFVSKDGNYNIGTWYGYDLGATTGIAPAKDEFALSVFPNPSRGRVWIRAVGCDASSGTASVVDASGRTVAHYADRPPGRDGFELDLACLHPGFYVLKFRLDDKAAAARIVIAR
jgi:DNA-binding beta-propeller fold protein YncE